MPLAMIEKNAETINKLLDVVTTSGIATGAAADLKKVETIKSTLNEGKKMALASGVAIDNVEQCL